MNQKIKFPRSEKVYLPGTLFPELRVAMQGGASAQYELH